MGRKRKVTDALLVAGSLVKELRIDRTCEMCPEQYDVYLKDEIVGYICLRNGLFTVNCPDVGGENVYTARMRDDRLGVFLTPEQRRYYMRTALEKIAIWYLENRQEGKAQCPEMF